MKMRSQVTAAVVAVFLAAGLAWYWYADAHPRYNPATYCKPRERSRTAAPWGDGDRLRRRIRRL